MPKDPPKCPVCNEPIFLSFLDHFYCYPWKGNFYRGEDIHKGCKVKAIELGYYVEPEVELPRYNLNIKECVENEN